MSATTEIAVYLIKTAAIMYTMIVILRFVLQLARADFYNPVSQFIVKTTNPPLKPLRKIIPGFFGLDIAAIALATLVQMVAIGLLLYVLGGPLMPEKMVTWALINTAALGCNIFYFSVLAGIVLSWVAPQTHHPMALLIFQINEPIMAPFRRLIPAVGGLDLSPIFVFIALHVIKILLTKAAIASGMFSIISFGI